MTATPPPAVADLAGAPTAALAVRAEGRAPAPRLSPRVTFLLRRLGRLLVSLVVVVVASFFLVHLVPGDPVRAALGIQASPELVAATRAELGLDKPIPVQFLDYVANLLRGDFGESIRTGRSVAETIGQRFPATVTLGVLSFLVALFAAVPLGIGAAVALQRPGRKVADAAVSGVLGMLIAVPGFLLAVGLIALFAVQLRWLPAAGWGTPQDAVLPVLALALGPMAYLARIVQVEMSGVLGATYMTTARAKRLPGHLVYLRHALPNIITASLTVSGLLLSGMIAGTVLIETVFAIPGMGGVMVPAVGAKDYPIVQGLVIVYALIILGVNLLVDLILVTVDPRSSITEG
ncbi:ABC transporter permease [Microbacterium sp. KSW4-17]|uniref:ABC transporter permease n=1 Tax=Microbacterium galbum TaxID=3075994 RepID=A0ABU3T7J4_9MICO|nr:ABC transporter permease [Microbacterium sp. KSW4-17]MDU0367348.1 ABC transporter permease [Microbacterium sp. KSW4-17]